MHPFFLYPPSVRPLCTAPPPPPRFPPGFRACQRMLHPSLLKVLDAVDTNRSSRTEGEFIVVTERCHPLSLSLSTLEAAGAADVCLLGCLSVLKGVSFMNASNNVHGNVTPDGVYVNERGDWRLFDYYVSASFEGGVGGAFRGGEGMVPKEYRR